MNWFGALAGYKTYIVGGLTVLTAVAGYFMGSVTAHDALTTIVPAILAMTVRGGITHETNKVIAATTSATPPTVG